MRLILDINEFSLALKLRDELIIAITLTSGDDSNEVNTTLEYKHG